MRQLINIATDKREDLVDITEEVAGVVNASGIRDGIVFLYAQGATSAIMIQENWDDSVQTDVIDCLAKLIPRGGGFMTARTETGTPT